MTKISHVEISVSDYAKSIRFYDSILIPLGWKRLVCQKSHTTFSDGGSKLVMCPVEEKYAGDGFHRKRVGLNHLAFYAESKEQVDTLFETILKPNGIRCLYEAKPRGAPEYYAVFFEDPDRIKIEVVFAPGYCEPDHWTNRLQDDFDPFEASTGGGRP
jgi:catechol 2,3-dioxygenase-like lactoylglutathione lyase family enzyme